MRRRDDEVELPYSPVKRWEKRFDTGTHREFDTHEFFRELIAIIRMNQEIVDEMVKANDSLRLEISKLPARLEEVSKNLNELVSYIKASAHDDRGAQEPSTTSAKIDQLIELNKKLIEANENVNSALDSIEKKIKRPLPPPSFRPMIR